MAELDVETARWLVSTAGLAAVAAATTQLDDGADELKVATDLSRRTSHPERRSAALGAAVARRRARQRWPLAEELLFTRAALEQASDPALSAHRAARLVATLGRSPAAAATIVDLCAGVGGDALALAQAAAGTGAPVCAVDDDPARLVLLAHNAEVAGVTVTPHHADALTFPLAPGAVVHADPSRRRDGRRVRRLADHLPSVPALLAAHLRTGAWALALSPGVALDDPDLPADLEDLEVEYVQLGDALVEATVWLGANDGGRPATAAAGATADATGAATGAAAAAPPAQPAGPGSHRRTRATLLQDGEVVASRLGSPATRTRLPVDEVGSVLIEPVPAAVRARVHDDLGRELGAWRVSAHRALLTCDVSPPPSPWYRARPVEAVLPARPKELRRWLGQRQAAGTERPEVELVLHGVDADPAELWRRLGRPRRGPHGLRLEFVRRERDIVTVVTRTCGMVGPDG